MGTINNYLAAHNSKKIPRSDFQPDRKFCQNAVEEYFKKGGTITKIKKIPDFHDVIHVESCGDTLDFGDFVVERY